jgi:hypothetical protein
MLYIVLAILQVGMSTHSSPLNFCKKNEKKDEQNMKCHNRDGSIDGSGVQMEFHFKQKREGVKGSS